MILVHSKTLGEMLLGINSIVSIVRFGPTGLRIKLITGEDIYTEEPDIEKLWENLKSLTT